MDCKLNHQKGLSRPNLAIIQEEIYKPTYFVLTYDPNMKRFDANEAL